MIFSHSAAPKGAEAKRPQWREGYGMQQGPYQPPAPQAPPAYGSQPPGYPGPGQGGASPQQPYEPPQQPGGYPPPGQG